MISFFSHWIKSSPKLKQTSAFCTSTDFSHMFPFGHFRLTPYRVFKACMFISCVITCSNFSSIAQFIRQPEQKLVAQITSKRSAAQPVHETPKVQAEQQEIQGALPLNTETLSLSEKPFDFRRDWWKYTIMLVAVALSGYYLTRIGTALLRFLAIVFCLIFSSGSAFLFGPILEPVIGEHFTLLPTNKCPPIAIAYFIIFLVAYIIAYLIVRLLRRPAESVEQKDQQAEKK